MPFDNMTDQNINIDVTHPSLDGLKGSVDASKMTPRERLECLRDFLRTPTPSVAWNFEDVEVDPECGTAGCAMGWWSFLSGHDDPCIITIAPVFGVSEQAADQMFNWPLAKRLRKPMTDVTPADVANAIDRYLQRARAIRDGV